MILALLALGCSRGQDAPDPAPPIERPSEEHLAEGPPGARLFYASDLGGLPSCVSCHELGSDEARVGPSLRTLPETASSRVPGLDARQYVRQSIVDPSAHVVAGFPDAMPQGYGTHLTEAQLDALVEFLLEAEDD